MEGGAGGVKWISITSITEPGRRKERREYNIREEKRKERGKSGEERRRARGLYA